MYGKGGPLLTNMTPLPDPLLSAPDVRLTFPLILVSLPDDKLTVVLIPVSIPDDKLTVVLIPVFIPDVSVSPLTRDLPDAENGVGETVSGLFTSRGGEVCPSPTVCVSTRTWVLILKLYKYDY